MLQHLKDLIAHQEWADAQQWRSIEAYPAAFENEDIRKRLHHIHITEYAFLLTVQGEHVTRDRFKPFTTMPDLKAYAIQNHKDMALFLQGITEPKLDEIVNIPWFKDPPLRITVAQALTQAAMHSHHHRAQNAYQIRELGGEPTMTDYIAWLWKGKPTADWNRG